MSSFSHDDNLIKILNDISIQINRYFSILIFVFGIPGNILNIFVFLHRSLRPNPCASLFLASSIANIIGTVSGLTTRILSGWAADLTNTVGWLCKVRVFILWITRAFFMWVIMLATVDRWLLSSCNVHYRQISTLKNARRGMFIILFVSMLINIDLLYCYEANLLETPLKCYSKTETCRLITDLTFALIIYTLPLFFMIVFGLLTIRNVHQARHHRIHPIAVASLTISVEPITRYNHYHSTRMKMIGRRLRQMLLIQVTVLTILTLPVAIQRLYSTLTLREDKSPLKIAVENLIFNLVILFNYASSGTPFYIFTLCGGSTFRNALSDLIRSIIRHLRHRDM
ncbi:unnamed protein product [Rotaria sp. Silwood2]|nr:unnamed protein product [Rotaria sp. Silwood2]CAF3125431.1 unnamed protein product [Rotaria sp. Silwood2]CAF3425743.1 unnamed protein product [Rotaria sp. Silwood2]CAF4366494.1 unnamed protein product [Rotaria sp. Silwood2]CAF4424268.1 unnamed protein product [Rotaria sp. Silwood2]